MIRREQDPAALLFEVVDLKRDPEGLITKFVQYENFRLSRDRYLSAMTGTVQDRLDVLMWYLLDYIAHRRGRFEMPLSESQIRFLNSPMPIAGASPALTVALYNFILREQPRFLKLDDPATIKDAVYWWCVERTPAARLEHALVTEEQTALLRTEEQWIGQDYPFNAFMVRGFEKDKDILELNASRPADRAAYFHYLLMQSYTKPHLHGLLPQDALRRSLREGKDGFALLDHVLARLALADGALAADGRALRQRASALAAKLTGGAAHRETRAKPRNRAESLIAHRDLTTHPVEPGVALIGPVHQTSGLGQAARLSYEILERTQRPRPTALPFDLEIPAPVGFSSKLNLAPFDRRREINLIHLNADLAPLAFAFAQKEIFSSSYNIGYFFWELNKIPTCHHLALELLDEIWVSSEYNREIYARYTDKPVINVGMTAEPLPDVQAASLEYLGVEPGNMVFLTTFDSFSFVERKNPRAVIAAFLQAFPRGDEPVNLLIKTQNRTRVFDPYQFEMWRGIDALLARDHRIIFVNEIIDYNELISIKKSCDCYVSLHRSEGFGLGIIEAMQLEKPTIVTNYGGNTEFCTPDTAILIDYDLIGVRTEEYIYVERGSVWADPDISQAAEAMRRVADDRAFAAALGASAARFVASAFSVEAIGRRYESRLAQIRAGWTPES